MNHSLGAKVILAALMCGALGARVNLQHKSLAETASKASTEGVANDMLEQTKEDAEVDDADAEASTEAVTNDMRNESEEDAELDDAELDDAELDDAELDEAEGCYDVSHRCHESWVCRDNWWVHNKCRRTCGACGRHGGHWQPRNHHPPGWHHHHH